MDICIFQLFCWRLDWPFLEPILIAFQRKIKDLELGEKVEWKTKKCEDTQMNKSHLQQALPYLYMKIQDILGHQNFQCPHFLRLGVCRDPSRCKKKHTPPNKSRILLIKNLYDLLPVDVTLANNGEVSKQQAEQAMQRFQEFYEDVLKELSNYGLIEQMIVAANINDHLKGNLYVKFSRYEQAQACLNGLHHRHYLTKTIQASLIGARHINAIKCRQQAEKQCQRAGVCNYVHCKPLSTTLKKQLFRQMLQQQPELKEEYLLNLKRAGRRATRQRRRERSRERSRESSQSRRRRIEQLNKIHFKE